MRTVVRSRIRGYWPAGESERVVGLTVRCPNLTPRIGIERARRGRLVSDPSGQDDRIADAVRPTPLFSLAESKRSEDERRDAEEFEGIVARPGEPRRAHGCAEEPCQRYELEDVPGPSEDVAAARPPSHQPDAQKPLERVAHGDAHDVQTDPSVVAFTRNVPHEDRGATCVIRTAASPPARYQSVATPPSRWRARRPAAARLLPPNPSIPTMRRASKADFGPGSAFSHSGIYLDSAGAFP